MEITLNINDKVADNLFVIYKSRDLNTILNKLVVDAVDKPNIDLDKFFGNVDYEDDYNYKELRHRNESIS